MDAIVKRLMEHRINEMTKKDAKGTLIDALQEEYPTCKVEWNSYHNCVDVIDERGQVIFQCYLDRDPHETTKYKYEKVDPSTLGPSDVVYKRVPAGKGIRYDYHVDKSLLKSVSSTSKVNESTKTNADFREEFDDAIHNGSDTQERINNVKALIAEYTSELTPEVVLSPEDLRQLGRDALEDRLYDIAYKCTNGTWLKVNDHIDYYCYNDGWVDTGYMYNVAKGAMTARNIFGSSSSTSCYQNLKYQLEHSKLKSVILLK